MQQASLSSITEFVSHIVTPDDQAKATACMQSVAEDYQDSADGASRVQLNMVAHDIKGQPY